MNQSNEYLKTATKLFTEGRYAEAEQACADAVKQAPGNSRAYYLYGLSCYKNNKLEEAARQFQKAVELNPKDLDSHFNLGVAYGELKRFNDAITAYESLLAKAPSYTKAIPNLAQALMKTGRYEEGSTLFNRALELSPDDSHTASLFMEFDCLYLGMPDRIACCDRVLQMPRLPDTMRHTALLYRATAEWAAQNMTALERSLSEANRIRPQPDGGFRNMVIYKTFLMRLLDYRKANAALYEGEGETLHLTGDSHSLTYAGLPLTLDGMHYKIATHLLIGTQARHLAAQEQDVKREALAQFMRGLPEKSKLLCAFGEIDCRANHGILPYWKKTGGSLVSIVEDVVANYVASIVELSLPKSLEPSFLSVPAPHSSSGDRSEVIALLNKSLEKHVREAGYRYIDLYTPTLSEGGVSHGRMHIDNYHLKPEVLGLTLA